MTATTQTVCEIALEHPTAIRVFEQFGIDYCCGGRRPLVEACAAGNLEIDAVLAALEAAEKKSGTELENWSEKSLESLSIHIVANHHAYVKRELQRLAQLAQKVVNRHGSTKFELPVIATTLMKLDEELTQHLAKEEAVLFPYIAALGAVCFDWNHPSAQLLRHGCQSDRDDDAGARCRRLPDC